MTDRTKQVERGDIYYADLPKEGGGSIQYGRRPVLIIQNNHLNQYSPTVIVVVITSQLKKTNMREHVILPMTKGLPKQSMVETEQQRTLERDMLLEYRCTLDENQMKRIDRALSAAIFDKTQYKQRRHRGQNSKNMRSALNDGNRIINKK